LQSFLNKTPIYSELFKKIAQKLENMKRMSHKQRIALILVIAATLAQGAATAYFAFVFYRTNTQLAAVHIAVVITLSLFYLVSKLFDKSNFHKLFSITIFCYFLTFLTMFIMYQLGALTFLASAQKVKDLVLGAGVWGVFIFIGLQIAQVIISPVPGLLTVAIGAQIFGPFLGFLYSSIGIVIGSIIAFSIGKLFGRKAVIWFLGKDAAQKYRTKLEKKGKYLLPLAFLFPVFPDDILCIIAGITTMTYKRFIAIVLLTRPIGVLLSSYLASGTILPLRGYYLFAWAAIGIFIAAAFIVIYKKQEQIENWFTKKFAKKK